MLFLKKASLRARGSAADQHDGLPPAGMGLCGAASGGTAQLPLAATSVRACILQRMSDVGPGTIQVVQSIAPVYIGPQVLEKMLGRLHFRES